MSNFIFDLYQPSTWKRSRGMRASCWFFIIGCLFTILSCLLFFRAVSPGSYENYYTLLVSNDSWLHFVLVLPVYLLLAPFIVMLFATAKQQCLGLRSNFAYMMTFTSELKPHFFRVGLYLIILCVFSSCSAYLGNLLVLSTNVSTSPRVIGIAVNGVLLISWSVFLTCSAALIASMAKQSIVSLFRPVLRVILLTCLLCAPWFFLSIAGLGALVNLLSGLLILLAYVFVVPQYILTLYEEVVSHDS